MRTVSTLQLILALSIVLMLSGVISAGAAAESNAADAPVLHFQNRVVDPLKDSLEDGLLPSEADSAKAESSSQTSGLLQSLRLFSLSVSSLVEDDAGYYVVQFSGPVQSGWKESISELGAAFYDYIPQYAFIVKISASRIDELRGLSFVRWVGEYVADLKLSSKVYDLTPEQLQEHGGVLQVRVVAFPGENLDALSREISAAGGSVLSSSSSKWNILINVEIPVADVIKLKDISGVKWVEKAPEHRSDNNIAAGIMEVRSVQSKDLPSSGLRLFGKGQIVGICDSGLDSGDPGSMHDDFSDGSGGTRIISCTAFEGAETKDYTGHGTHVAGAVAGNGLMSGSTPSTGSFPDTCYAGIAPQAKLFIQSAGYEGGNGRLVGIPSDLNDLFQPAYDAGARIHTDSWGTTGPGDYSSESLNTDQFMWAKKDFLVLFAAGNGGYDKDMDGVTDPYCIDSPATAKNCLSVGASESYRVGGNEGFASSYWGQFRTYAEPIKSDLTSDKPYGLASFSARGPTIDGRHKPEVVAPGTNILSTRSAFQTGDGWGAFNDYYYWSGGTSMATPLVAGTAALLREYLISEEGISNPSAALIKTALIHGAVSLVPGQFGTGDTQEVHSAPDYAQGWGRIDLESSINSDSSYKMEYHDVTDSAPEDTDYSRTFSFDVGDDAKPFKATLGWTDYPGSVAAGGGLVNDLDLRVQRPDGTWVYPDNAVDLSSLTEIKYVTSVDSKFLDGALGLVVTPPSYPATLESVVLAFSNTNSEARTVSVAVYRFDGEVGDEIFRDDYAYIPSGEFGIPVGVMVSSGSVLVSVEKHGGTCGLWYENGNTSGRGMVLDSGVWKVAEFTPAMIVNFRSSGDSSEFDRINNTVSVSIKNPESGTYTAEVTAHNVPMGPQPYALVLSGMTGAAPTDGDIELNEDQPDAPEATILSKSNTSQTAEGLNTSYGAKLDSVYGDVASFSIQTTNSSLVSVKYAVSGLPAVEARSLNLVKLFSNGTSRDFSYAELEQYNDGNWWLTDVGGVFVSPVQVLNATTPYYIVSVVQDNGSFDDNRDEGIIDDPQILGARSSESSATGCTIGVNDDYGPVLLLLIAVLSLLLRRIGSALPSNVRRTTKP
ncbi:S8 family serine peptidase [Maridesulfovibrio sp.]|uniref:S8 family serine peptidase n=1 Tax=Maridesulfovibrio sp. TaxID=2795000 RepID=UPI002A18CDEE|nr:S8 family serine peptidase [Maridesulfovibrio sp.]